MEPLIAILVIAGLGWLWLAGSNAHEAATAAGQTACRRYGVQLLDQTVALSKLRLRRHWNGRLGFYREYRFEFTTTGDERSAGTVRMLGSNLEGVDLDLDALRTVKERPTAVRPQEQERIEVREIEPVPGAKIVDLRSWRSERGEPRP